MLQVFIGDTEVVCDRNIVIDETLLATSNTILNNCYPKSWELDHDYVSRFFMPKDYSNVRIYLNNSLYFSGVLKNTGNILLRPTEPKYANFQVLDYKTLLSEGKTLDFVISNKTITQAITQVVNAVSEYGFVVGNININNANEIIGAYSTLDKTAYDVFQYLAEISQTLWFTRVIDEDTVAIDFYSPENLPKATNIEYTKEYFEDNNIVDIYFSYSSNDYRNRQIILSDQVYGNIEQNDRILANGYQNTYQTNEIIGIANKVLVNNVEKTIALKEYKELGVYADFYYEAGKNQIEASNSYTAGTVINVLYTPLIKGRQVVYNGDEISRVSNQINRSGAISRYEKRNDILSSDELGKVAQTYIDYKGSAEITLTVRTHDKDLFNVGQQVFFDIPELTELQRDYLVKAKKTERIQSGNQAVLFYTYELSSNFNADTAINYFDNQRRKASGNIRENEFITRNIDIDKQTIIEFKELECEEITISDGNVLNCTLNAPFTS